MDLLDRFAAARGSHGEHTENCIVSGITAASATCMAHAASGDLVCVLPVNNKDYHLLLWKSDC